VPFVNVTLVTGGFTEEQKHAVTADLTDVMAGTQAPGPSEMALGANRGARSTPRAGTSVALRCGPTSPMEACGGDAQVRCQPEGGTR
jgi:hypothetical protein